MKLTLYQREKLIKIREKQNVERRAKKKEDKVKRHTEWLHDRGRKISNKQRNDITPYEKRLREALLIEGLKFSFQKYVIAYPTVYVPDFTFEHNGIKLILELDGKYHYTDKGRRHDAKRDAKLRKMGYKVIRFSNKEAMDVDYVITYIKAKLNMFEWCR